MTNREEKREEIRDSFSPVKIYPNGSKKREMGLASTIDIDSELERMLDEAYEFGKKEVVESLLDRVDTLQGDVIDRWSREMLLSPDDKKGNS